MGLKEYVAKYFEMCKISQILHLSLHGIVIYYLLFMYLLFLF
jgi:hypothetical protein